jgi:predicted Fe-Mo cluster-binding NifX family protein
MLVAVPLLGSEVAPRFGFADSFLIGEIEDGRVVCVDRVEALLRGFVNRLNALRGLGVDVILCGGFNRAFLPLAEDFEIGVLAGAFGDARQVLEGFARGELVRTGTCRGDGSRGGRCEAESPFAGPDREGER